MNEKPSVASVVGPLIAALPRADQPPVVALAERIAAGRYRAWAEAIEDATASAELLACAAREEEIAARVEALFADAGDIQQAFRSQHPDVEARYAAIFEGLPLHTQLATQAEGERLGAATWRSFAEDQSSAERRAVFLTCAELEEQSAEVLETLVGEAA